MEEVVKISLEKYLQLQDKLKMLDDQSITVISHREISRPHGYGCDFLDTWKIHLTEGKEVPTELLKDLNKVIEYNNKTLQDTLGIYSSIQQLKSSKHTFLQRLKYLFTGKLD